MSVTVGADAPSGSPNVGFVGTYPPTTCGIATFTAALRDAMALPRSSVIACVDTPGDGTFGPEVVGTLVRGSFSSRDAAVAKLSRLDLVIVQHEFGIYGGADGSEIVDLVAALDVPVIVVLHTVVRTPSPNQQSIVEALASMATLVVVQSQAARSRLLETYEVPAARVRVVPHGARMTASPSAGPDHRTRPVVLTWGLLGRGKGIEYAIEALASLRDLEPAPRYVVHGKTHPRVTRQEGEAYRESLVQQAKALAVEEMVEFDDRYLDAAAVLAWIRKASVVLLPYRSREQVVSGVLVEAIASGTPVIATRFPHAEELLRAGSGILVPHEDPGAIAAALRSVLSDPELHWRMAEAARRQAPQHGWKNVGRAYRELAWAVLFGTASVGDRIDAELHRMHEPLPHGGGTSGLEVSRPSGFQNEPGALELVARVT